MNPSREPKPRTESRRITGAKIAAVATVALGGGLTFSYIEQTGRVPFVDYETEQDEPSCVTIDTLTPDVSIPADEVTASLIILDDLVDTEDC